MIALASRSPTEVAESLTGRNYLSWSAISTYLKCPLRYRFRYLDGLPEEFVAANLVFGQAIHAAFDAFFQHQLVTGHALELDPLLAVYHEHWRQIDVGAVQFNKGDDVTALGQLAERMLGTFVASDVARPEGQILGIEEELQAPVIDGVPDLLARLDLLVDTGNAVVIRDFKTSRSRWSEADVEASSGQLLLYHELVRRFVDKPVRLQFAVLTKTKAPQFDLHDVPADSQRIARIRQLVARVWRAIQGGNFYPAPTVMNCTTRPFQRACAGWPGD
jgi:putative RecB family exonuclease